ncbi:MAG: restriction endonuclease subunit S [Deltaproteobacteria bacterium]|nr:restriction endonuclease subunit S [Deltaproteobacteria bacterium]
MRWQPYPGYKPSGVDWLGEVPERWAIKRLKYSAQLINEKVEARDTDLPYIGLEHIESWTGKRIITAEPSSSEGQSNRIRLGDVLFGKLRPYLAKVHRASEDGICTGELLVLKPKCVTQHFLFYYMLSKDFISVVDSSTYGAKMPRASWEFIGNLPTLVPSQDEQRAITDFLDRETGRIDALIEKKQRQIELLQEKRAALISHAVTKGLDPNTSMKDSGVEWLGKIPAYWEVKRLKFLIGFVTSGSRGWSQYYSDEGAIFLRIGNLSRFSLNLNLSDIQFVTPPAGTEVERTRVQKDDVLISITAYVGSISVIEEDIGEAYVNQHIALTRPMLGKGEPKWLGYVLLSEIGQHQFRIQLYGGTKEGFGLDDVKGLSILLPPPFEQKTIVSFLNQETGKIDTLINIIRDSIDRLKEYRTALISAAVTGKIDVRDEVRKVPSAFPRIVLAAEIVHRLHHDPHFGRVKLQKVLYLCEHHLGMDLQGNYWRQAAGPLDNRMLHSVEKQLERQKWFAPLKNGWGTRYAPLEKAGGHRKYFDNYWADYREGLDSLLELMRPLNTEQSEIVATLYAAWNDLVIAGRPFSDEDILHEVKSWHESKERFDEDRLRRALKWMRDQGLVPRGLGRATRTER